MKILSAVRSFLRNERGSIAATFALTSVALLLFIGITVDYTRQSDAHLRLQNAVDSAVLAIAHEAKTNSNTDDLEQFAAAHMASLLPSGYEFEITSLTKNGSNLILEATGSVPAGITAVAGYDQFNQTAVSEAYWGTGKLEIALVLDNTGSMASYNRMTEMKNAANALLDALETSEPGLVKTSIVPFDTNVRVPTSYKSASWFTVNWLIGLFWQGCITDRDQSNDVSDAPVTSSSSTKYPGALCSSNSLQTIQPLTDNFTTLRNKINAMNPAGNTNITIGLAWGLALLSDQVPFTEGAAWGTKDLTKIMVLMTDGDNTENRWTSSSSAIDARTELACQSVKDAGVTLFTVRLMEGNAELLSECATSVDTYYDVENVQDLVPAFEAIGEQISQLRIAR
jgi:Flp pilus assembly protein TadG